MKSDDRYSRFIGQCCSVLEVSVDDVLGHCREAGPVMLARFALVYLLRERFGLSYPMLGRILRRDHTTCMNSYRRFAKMLADGDRFATQIIEQTADITGVLLELESPLETLRRCAAVVRAVEGAVG